MNIIDPPSIMVDVNTIGTITATVERIRALGRTIDTSAVQQGVYIADLKEKEAWATLKCDSWAAFCTEYLKMSSRTAHRRIRASQWHTVYGIALDALYFFDYTVLDQLYDVPTDINPVEIGDVYHEMVKYVGADAKALTHLWMDREQKRRAQEIVDRMLDGASVSDILTLFGIVEEKPVAEPAQVIFLRCPHCDKEFEA